MNQNKNRNALSNSNSNNPTLSNQVSKAASNALQKGRELTNKIKNTSQGVTNAIKEKANEVKQKVSNVTENPSIKEPVSRWSAMTKSFLEANTTISKFVGFILALLLFIILFQLGMGILQRFIGPQYNPYILNGMVPSDTLTVISANPNVKGSIPIYRSVDQNQGVEFSWNVWFFVNKKAKRSRIFSKGMGKETNSMSDNVSVHKINVSPGLFIENDDYKNVLTLVMNTYDVSKNDTTYTETITVENIPMQKWVCCTIRVQGTYVDIYINGVLTQRKILMNLPKQNYYDTYVGDSGGFDGYVSSLRYYASAIGYDEVQSLFAAGPSLKMLTSSNMPKSNDYLSMNWYYST